MALGAAEWELVQPGAEVMNFPRRWQELRRALLRSTEHGKGVSLQQRNAEEVGGFGPLLGDKTQPEGAGPASHPARPHPR